MVQWSCSGCVQGKQDRVDVSDQPDLDMSLGVKMVTILEKGIELPEIKGNRKYSLLR